MKTFRFGMLDEPPPDSDATGAIPEHSSLAKLYRRAAERGWRCLSGDWRGSRACYVFRCARGHCFERKAETVLRTTTVCPGCRADEVRQRFDDRLGERGFTRLDADFLGLSARYRLRCALGHEWTTLARRIMEGYGCPTCANAARAAKYTRADGLERMRRIAAAHGGRCLAGRYEGTIARYQWECAAGHRWEASAATVVKGSWCARCAVRRVTEGRRSVDGLERLRAMAASRGGALVDPVYAGVSARYMFRCARGHEWQTEGTSVLGGSWCKKCEGIRRRLTIEAMQQAARERGGCCLSVEYLGNNVRLLWECHRGHVWEAVPSSVLSAGRWCPNCARLRVTKDPAKRLKYDFEGRE